jgi:phosphoglucosamine mutase
MSNSGFYKFARQAGVMISTSKVGGHNVIAEMRKSGCNLGGEKSGNIFFLDDSTTSDGLLTGTKIMSVMKKTGSKMSELGKMVQLNPQVLINARVARQNRTKWRDNSEITQLIMDYSSKLGTEGRLYVRESGTEPLVRIMIEGKRTGLITEYAKNIASAIERIYGENAQV